ncbi:MAG: Nramp family divalent metal transporter [Candidatus Hydrogenedentes bacterium]|nr:Nramp family divalent metal transporter [Candidatus Hydrogenedentota bacterium]
MKRLGPGLITAAVVLGPGSIVASSRAGAESAYGLVWMLLLACIIMATFTAMGARFGCAVEESPLQYIARRWGRPLAALTGISAFLVTAGFQFGNNIGVSVAFSGITGLPAWIWPVFFTALAVVFLLRAREIYALLEKVMIVLVACMVVAFVANLFWTGLDPAALLRGLRPRAFEGNEPIIARAMLGTTFSAVAAFYQAYLVQAKGWRRENVKVAIGDAWIGIAILGGIALVIMIGAAETLHGTGRPFTGIGDLAHQLSAVLGPWATIVFCLGVGAASFSSFIANALFGGALMADGLGQDGQVSSAATRGWTVGVMLAGCLVALGVLLAGQGSTTSLLIAQAATLIAAPLCAVLLFVLSSSRAVMGDLRNGWASIVLGGIGLLLVLGLNVILVRAMLAQLQG